MTWDERTARVAERLRLAAQLLDEGAVSPPGYLNEVLASAEAALARARVAEQLLSGVGDSTAAVEQAERLATLAALLDGRPDLARQLLELLGGLLSR